MVCTIYLPTYYYEFVFNNCRNLHRSVQHKRLMKNTIEEGGDIYRTLLAYRNTPVYGMYTPSQLLMSRILRDEVPKTKEMLTPKIIDKKNYFAKMTEARGKTKTYYDLKTKERQDFHENDEIYYQEKPKSVWKRRKILEREDEHTHRILTDEGRILRRNNYFLKQREDGRELRFGDEELNFNNPNSNDMNPTDTDDATDNDNITGTDNITDRDDNDCEEYQQQTLRRIKRNTKYDHFSGSITLDDFVENQTPGQRFDVQVFIVIIDNALSALTKRMKAYHKITSVFEVFRQLKSLTSEEILEKSSSMVSAYEDDLENSLGGELVQFAELLKTDVATVIDSKKQEPLAETTLRRPSSWQNLFGN